MASAVTSLIAVLQIVVPVALLVLSGVALTLSLWIIPLLCLPSTSPETSIAQFAETIRRGGTFLQPFTRLLAASLALLTLFTYFHDNAEVKEKWVWYAGAGGVLAQAVWWEQVAIFWINDRVCGMGGKFRGDGEGERARRELDELLVKWRVRHSVRIACPAVAGLLCVVALV